jgi:hypothetical protein
VIKKLNGGGFSKNGSGGFKLLGQQWLGSGDAPYRGCKYKAQSTSGTYKRTKDMWLRAVAVAWR